ncbi:hypothetical protein C5E45_18290 [Nocardia nova]|uniref:Uncharacterized protein n=1 Tax=Nocardia nova TaxID=37330 RepID=A0A2S6ANE9_9NOCA|nr:hypothetical protein [Nocardia nova]PPJ23349.1 hypothetical protein C5E41_25155 [Nocardia nova]PPJ36765.1 hypothetical protein C5E45_18290 [Nocardia nova]
MTDYAAEFDRILADYRAGSRGVQEHFLEVDARTTSGGAELFAELREKLRDEQQERSETPGEVAADERSERDRLLSEAAERARMRAAERRKPQSVGRDVVVMPSDWTDEDEARAEGYGPPESWLR